MTKSQWNSHHVGDKKNDGNQSLSDALKPAATQLNFTFNGWQ
jgi:hypothetical protein